MRIKGLMILLRIKDRKNIKKLKKLRSSKKISKRSNWKSRPRGKNFPNWDLIMMSLPKFQRNLRNGPDLINWIPLFQYPPIPQKSGTMSRLWESKRSWAIIGKKRSAISSRDSITKIRIPGNRLLDSAGSKERKKRKRPTCKIRVFCLSKHAAPIPIIQTPAVLYFEEL